MFGIKILQVAKIRFLLVAGQRRLPAPQRLSLLRGSAAAPGGSAAALEPTEGQRRSAQGQRRSARPVFCPVLPSFCLMCLKHTSVLHQCK